MKKAKKSDIFKLFAPCVGEDGTYDRLLEAALKHPEQNPRVIERACREISAYVNFCMDISTDAYSLDQGKYVHFAKKGENVDRADIIIRFWRNDYGFGKTEIHISEEAPNAEASALLAMMREEISAKTNPSEDDLARKSRYGGGYAYLLSKMLDGKTYFPDDYQF